MTFAQRPVFPDRAFGFLGSLAIHIALGLALFAWSNDAPGGRRVADRRGSSVLVVDLVPLPSSTASAVSKSGGGVPPLPRAIERKAVFQDRSGPMRADRAEGGNVPDGGKAANDRRGAATDPETQQGTVQSRSGEESQQFRTLLLRHIERYRRYPLDAQQAGIEGTVRVHFLMDRDGRVLDIWVEMSSGSRLLDEEAMAAVMRARPLPPPPAGWPGRFGVTLPIGFSLK